MIRVLLTGMSGTGKSTVIQALSARGYTAIDLDEPDWSAPDADGRWTWDAARVADRLAQADCEVLFLSGCTDCQVQMYPQLDHIVLLSAPAAVLTERLRTRTTNDYGKRPEELAEVLGYLETVEPLLRRSATLEIDTRAPLDQVLERLLAVVLANRP